MIVYRYLSEEEYKNIIEKKLDKIGNTFDSKKLSNTFHYKKGERYLHFYKKEESMKKMQSMRVRDGKDYYNFSKVPYYDIDFTSLTEIQLQDASLLILLIHAITSCSSRTSAPSHNTSVSSTIFKLCDVHDGMTCSSS